MKHAGDETLDTLETTLVRLRRFDALHEKKRGVFYRNSRAFLHFHEDPEGIFADLQTGGLWTRTNVTAATQRSALLRQVFEILEGE